jgi:hypothetical protein
VLAPVKRWLLGIFLLFCEEAKKTRKFLWCRATKEGGTLLTSAARVVLLIAGRDEETSFRSLKETGV